jgi:hypothetical protein
VALLCTCHAFIGHGNEEHFRDYNFFGVLFYGAFSIADWQDDT